MRRAACYYGIAFVLAGPVAACAGATVPIYGNFAPSAPAAELAMATDAARLTSEIYPAATTTLRLEHRASDRFGRTFVALLRRDGFAISEPKTGRVPGALPLHYVLAPLEGARLLQLSVTIGDVSLSRAYRRSSRTAYPVSDWTQYAVPGEARP